MPDNNNGLAFSRRHEILNREEPKISKATAKWMERMVWEVNKFPYSRCRKLALFKFNRNELEWYYMEIRKLVDTVVDILECQYCEDTIKKAVLPACGCSNPVAFCSKCFETVSKCPNCDKQCSSSPFEAIDQIVHECHLFYKEKGFNSRMKCSEGEQRRMADSYFRFLKQSEMELMCDYCFSSLEKTMTVKRKRDGVRLPLCSGCHELHMECYDSSKPSPYPTFDRLNREYANFFEQVLTFCERYKSQAYSDPLPPVEQPNFFKRRGLRRTGLKGKLYGLNGVFKKAAFVAVCALIVFYYVK